jgi:hypothetical protein
MTAVAAVLDTQSVPTTWEQAAERVALYLGALGITDPLQRERVIARVRQRWEVRVNAAPQEDRVETAIEETSALVDAWLVTELGIEDDHDALYRARAALLSGTVPNWQARFAGISGDSLATRIRAAVVQAVPEPAPLTMEPNTIELCCARIRRRIVAAFRILIGRDPVTGPDAVKGGH